jgi:hypothetical protein
MDRVYCWPSENTPSRKYYVLLPGKLSSAEDNLTRPTVRKMYEITAILKTYLKGDCTKRRLIPFLVPAANKFFSGLFFYQQMDTQS